MSRETWCKIFISNRVKEAEREMRGIRLHPDCASYCLVLGALPFLNTGRVCRAVIETQRDGQQHTRRMEQKPLIVVWSYVALYYSLGKAGQYCQSDLCEII